MVAVDADTGAIRWRTTFPRAADPSLGTNSAGGPVFYGDLVIATSGDGAIHAFDLEGGAIRWSLPRVSDVPLSAIIKAERDFRPLAISGSTLLSGSLTGVVIAFDLTTRQERWRFYSPLSGSTVFRMTADESCLYLPYFSGELVTLDVKTGVERWRIGDWRLGFVWAPFLWGDRIFASATGSGFYAFNRCGSDGSQR
jgi:hypothetical protein